MTEKDVLRSLVGFSPRCRWSPSVCTLVTHSTGVSRWESDLLVIHKTGWVDEVEVKVSVSDFRAEFKKKTSKHEALQLGYVPKRGGGKMICKTVAGTPSRFDGIADGVKIIDATDYTIIRRFWFAMPAEVYEKVEAEIPAYAGVLVIGPKEYLISGDYHWHQWYEKKRPEQLPSRKATDEDIHRALLSVYYRAWAAKAKEELL